MMRLSLPARGGSLFVVSVGHWFSLSLPWARCGLECGVWLRLDRSSRDGLLLDWSSVSTTRSFALNRRGWKVASLQVNHQAAQSTLNGSIDVVIEQSIICWLYG
jgi:hypothetical protein